MTEHEIAEMRALCERATHVRTTAKIEERHGEERYIVLGHPCGFPVATFGDANDAYLFIRTNRHLPELLAERERLREGLRELLVAVRYADPPRDFGSPDEPNLCHEARIPTDFVTNAERALNPEPTR